MMKGQERRDFFSRKLVAEHEPAIYDDVLWMDVYVCGDVCVYCVCIVDTAAARKPVHYAMAAAKRWRPFIAASTATVYLSEWASAVDVQHHRYRLQINVSCVIWGCGYDRIISTHRRVLPPSIPFVDKQQTCLEPLPAIPRPHVLPPISSLYSHWLCISVYCIERVYIA